MTRRAWTGDHAHASPGAAECARQDAMRRAEDDNLYARMGWPSPSAARTAEPGTAPSVAAPTPSAVHTPTPASVPTTTETVSPPLPTAPGTKGTKAAGAASRTVTGDAAPARQGLLCADCGTTFHGRAKDHGHHPLCASCRAIPCAKCGQRPRASIYPATHPGQRRWCGACRQQVNEYQRNTRNRNARRGRAA